ncbi:MAG TPA: M20/M25/M40 family metallo-hydrolase, partial [Solirubrobacteraceae bacterium]
MAAPTTPEGLRRLLTAPGPSGYEAAPAAVFRELASAFAEVGDDTVGNSVARVAGAGDGPLLAIIGHADEIGVIVSHIDDNGFLRFRGVGGWDTTVLVGQRVELMARDGVVPGVIGRKPIHLLEGDARKKAPEMKELHIDIGARDADDARRRVRIGDVGVLAAEPLDLEGGLLVSRALDNRLGCWIALEAARRIHEGGGIAADVAAVAATQEELIPRAGGAGVSAYALEPDVVVVVDVTWETRQPGVELGETSKAEFGMGAVISRGTTLHPGVSEALIEAAEAEGVPYVLEATSRGTFTDADSVYMQRGGIPTGLVSVPTRYLHSPAEMVDLADVEACIDVLVAFARRLEA